MIYLRTNNIKWYLFSQINKSSKLLEQTKNTQLYKLNHLSHNLGNNKSKTRITDIVTLQGQINSYVIHDRWRTSKLKI